MKSFLSQLLFLIQIACNSFTSTDSIAQTHSVNKVTVPIGGNAWVNKDAEINNQGLVNWTNTQTICTVYVRVNPTSNLKMSVFINPQNGSNKIRVTLLNKSFDVAINGNGEQEYFVGEWNLVEAGYLPIQIKGMSKTGSLI